MVKPKDSVATVHAVTEYLFVKNLPSNHVFLKLDFKNIFNCVSIHGILHLSIILLQNYIHMSIHYSIVNVTFIIISGHLSMLKGFLV